MFGVSVGVVIAIGIIVFVAQRYLLNVYANSPSQQHYRQLIVLGIWLLALILAVLVIPVGDQMRGQLLSFLGILLSATIALSSTTIVGNAMAGLMVRSLRSFRVGDHIRVGDHYGRISNMDLLHVEIQTEDRDLTTLPNLYMVAHPVTVLRDSGTLLHVEVSLGYDVSRQTVEQVLLSAAEKTGLEKPCVQIRMLGDFSISYRISGLLTDISKLIATRRRLRANTLDALHDAGIEIVSPNYMNTRALHIESQILPERTAVVAESEDQADPDQVVFDKATLAEEVADMKQAYTEQSQRFLEIEQALKNAGPGEERRPLSLEKKKLEAAMARAAKQIEAAEAKLEQDKK